MANNATAAKGLLRVGSNRNAPSATRPENASRLLTATARLTPLRIKPSQRKPPVNEPSAPQTKITNVAAPMPLISNPRAWDR
ncbi:hypothetical protein D3C87_1177550 [compost metagenome]